MARVRFAGPDVVECIMPGEEIAGMGYSLDDLRDDWECRQEFLENIIVPVAVSGVGGGVSFTEARMEFLEMNGDILLRTLLHCPEGKREEDADDEDGKDTEMPDNFAELLKEIFGIGAKSGITFGITDNPVGGDEADDDGAGSLLQWLLDRMEEGDEEEISEFTLLAEFPQVEDAVRFSKAALPGIADAGSVLVRTEDSACMLLYFSGECAHADALACLAAEYGAEVTEDEGRVAYVTEHGRVLVSEDAVEQLAGL